MKWATCPVQENEIVSISLPGSFTLFSQSFNHELRYFDFSDRTFRFWLFVNCLPAPQSNQISVNLDCPIFEINTLSFQPCGLRDPFAKGAENPDDDPDPDEDLCALEYAALYGHFDIFKLKQIRLDPNHSISEELMRWACRADTADFLKELIKNGFKPDGYENSGSSLIQACISNMGWTFDFYSSRQRKDIDNSESREKIKMIYLLAEKGAKWMPGDRYEVNDARRSLLKMKPDYTVEFIWIMSKFSASIPPLFKQFRTKLHPYLGYDLLGYSKIYLQAVYI